MNTYDVTTIDADGDEVTYEIPERWHNYAAEVVADNVGAGSTIRVTLGDDTWGYKVVDGPYSRRLDLVMEIHNGKDDE